MSQKEGKVESHCFRRWYTQGFSWSPLISICIFGGGGVIRESLDVVDSFLKVAYSCLEVYYPFLKVVYPFLKVVYPFLEVVYPILEANIVIILSIF